LLPFTQIFLHPLHFILQIAFDWDDVNLHRFFIHGKDYGIYHSGGMSFSDDPYQVQLADFKFRKSEKFLYEYDFFNSWTHLIRIEDILSFDPKKNRANASKIVKL